MTAGIEPWPTGRRRPVRSRPAPPLPADPRLLRRAPPRPEPPPIDLTAPRPRIVDDPGILGLSRLARGKFGSRLFTLFFVFVYGVILIQLIASLLDP